MRRAEWDTWDWIYAIQRFPRERVLHLQSLGYFASNLAYELDKAVRHFVNEMENY